MENNGSHLLKFIAISSKIEKVKIGKFEINFMVAGESTPLILIHGATIGWGQWLPNINAFAKHFKVLALDLPGSGGSSKINFRKADLIKDFVDVIDEFIKIKKLDNVNILGHSFGGWLALKVAQKNSSIKKVVLVSPLGFDTSVPWHYKLLAFYPFAKLISKTVMKPTRKNMEKFLLSVMKNIPLLQAEFIDYFFENIAYGGSTHPILFSSRFSGFFSIERQLHLKNILPHVKNDCLVIFGENDPLIRSRHAAKIAATLPSHKVDILPNTGHVPSTEQSELFNHKVIAFLTHGGYRFS